MSRIAQQPWWSIAPAPSEPPEYPDDEWLEEICDEVWHDPRLLAEALYDAHPSYTDAELVRMKAEQIRENRRERGY